MEYMDFCWFVWYIFEGKKKNYKNKILKCATFGASACYGLSYTFGRGIIVHFFPNQLVNFKKKVTF